MFILLLHCFITKINFYKNIINLIHKEEIISYVFLFLFYFMGDSSSYAVVPQPNMDVCNHNGCILVNPPNGKSSVWETIGEAKSHPYNNFKCVDLSKELPVDFVWNYKQ